MTQKIYIVVSLILLLCCGNVSTYDRVDTIYMNAIIPENASDSLKTVIIKGLIEEIDSDTALVQRIMYDTLNLTTELFYRHDTLVKIMHGYSPMPRTLESRNLQRYSFTTYYFLKVTLIFSRYDCNINQHTGRCNPVYAHNGFYFYQNKIIHETYDSNVDFPFQLCGCEDLSYDQNQDHINEPYELKVINEANRLLE